MELGHDGEHYNYVNMPPTRLTEKTVRKRLFRSPTAAASLRPLNSLRPTLSPLQAANRDAATNSRVSFDRQFLATPQPTRVEKLSGRKRPSIADIEGTPSIRKRLVVTNTAACESRQATDLSSWLNHELLHPFHLPSSISAVVLFPQYRLSEDPSFLRSLNDMHNLWASEQFTALRSRLSAGLRTSRIDFKEKIDLFNDISLRRKWASLFLSNYHPGWLLPSLSVIFGSNLAINLDFALCSAQNSGIQPDENSVLLQFLEDVLLTDLLSPHQCMFFRLSGSALPSSPRLSDVERTNFHLLILQRTLELVLFLDACKCSSRIVLQADPSLFRTDSKMKSSFDIVTEISNNFFSNGAYLNIFLRIHDVQLSYEVPACEVMRSLHVDNLVVDLRDGIRLCKMAALLTRERGLLYKVRVPKAQNMQREIHNMKVFNVELAMRALQRFAVEKFKHRFAWYCTPADIVDGNLSKLLAFLWQLVALWRDSELLKAPSLEAELKVVQETFRENKRRVPRLSQSPTADMSLAEISPSVVSPSNLRIFENCDNPNSKLLLEWCAVVCGIYGLSVRDFTESFRDGAALCLLLCHYYPDIVHLDEFVRLKPAELQTNEESSLKVTLVQNNFNIFTDKVRLLGFFPHIPISAEAAHDLGASERTQSFGRLVDLLVSYLFSLITVQKESAELKIATSLLFEKLREKNVLDQAAKLITNALKHLHVKRRMEVIERSASPNNSLVGDNVSPNSDSTFCSFSRSLRSPSYVANGNGSSQNSASRRRKPKTRSPFAGPTSYQKYLPSPPGANDSPRSEQGLIARQVISSNSSRSPKSLERGPAISVRTSDLLQTDAYMGEYLQEKKESVNHINRDDNALNVSSTCLRSVVLLQASVRGFLARKHFKPLIDEADRVNLKRLEENSSHQSGTMGLSAEMEAKILSTLCSKTNLAESICQQVYEHVNAINNFKSRMLEYEKHPNESEITSSVDKNEEQSLPCVDITPKRDFGDLGLQPTQIEDPLTCHVNTTSLTKENVGSEDIVDISNSPVPQSLLNIQNCAEPSSPWKPNPSLDAVLRSVTPKSERQDEVDDISEGASMVMTARATSPLLSPGRPSRTMTPVEIRRVGPFSKAFGFANRLASMVFSFSSEIVSHVDDSLADGHAAMVASGLKSSSRSGCHDIDSQMEDVAHVRQCLARSRSPLLIHGRTPRKIMAPSESEFGDEDDEDDEDDENDDDRNSGTAAKDHLSRALQIASERFYEEQEKCMRDREMIVEQTAKQKFELQVKLEKLDTEKRNDEILFAKSLCSLGVEMENLRTKYSTLEQQLSVLEEAANRCEEEVQQDLDLFKDSQNSVENDAVTEEYVACKKLFDAVYADRLKVRLSEAEFAFVQCLSNLRASRRKHAELQSSLEDLKTGSLRLEDIWLSNLNDVNIHLRNVEQRRASFLEALDSASKTEAVYDVDISEISCIDDTNVPYVSYNEFNDVYEGISQQFDELLRSRLSDLLEDAQNVFEKELENRKAFHTMQWVKRRQTSCNLRELVFQTRAGSDSYITEMESLELLSRQVSQNYHDLQLFTSSIPEPKEDDDDLTTFSMLFADEEEIDSVSSIEYFPSLGFDEELNSEFECVQRQRCCEVLEDAEEKFMEFMSNQRAAHHESWVYSRNKEICNQESEQKEALLLHAVYEEEERTQEQMLRSRLYYDEMVELIIRSTWDERCNSAIAMLDELPASEEEYSDALSEEYELTLFQESKIRYERELENLVEIHELACERFARVFQFRRVQRMDDWVQRKELAINIRSARNEATSTVEFPVNGPDDDSRIYSGFLEELDNLVRSTTMKCEDATKLIDLCNEYVSTEQSWVFDDVEQIYHTVNSYIEKEQLHSKWSDTFELAEDLFDDTLALLFEVQEEAMLRRSGAQTILQIFAAQEERDYQSMCEADIQSNSELLNSKMTYDNYSDFLSSESTVMDERLQSFRHLEDDLLKHNISPENNEIRFVDSSGATNTLFREILATRQMEEIEKRLESAESRFKEELLSARSQELDFWLGKMKLCLDLRELATCQEAERQSFVEDMTFSNCRMNELKNKYQQASVVDMSWQEHNVPFSDLVDFGDSEDNIAYEKELMALIHDTEQMLHILINEQGLSRMELENLPVSNHSEVLGSEAENEHPVPIAVENHVFIPVRDVKLDTSEEFNQPSKFTHNNLKHNDNEMEEVAVISMRQARRSTGRQSRRPLQNVVIEGDHHESSPVLIPASDLDGHAPLLSSEFQTEDDEFVSLSSFASAPSPIANRWGILPSQLYGEQANVIGGPGLNGQLGLLSTPGQAHASSELAQENNLDERLATSSVSLWRIGESLTCLPDTSLGRLSAELDALAKGMSPNESDFLLPRGDSINELKVVMRRISEAAASSSSRSSPETQARMDSTAVTPSVAEGLSGTNVLPHVSPCASIIRNVLMVMRQCIRSDEYMTLVRLGMKIVRDFCVLFECMSVVLEVQDSIDIISTCVQFYRDDEEIFSGGVDVLFQMSQDVLGLAHLREQKESLTRLGLVKDLVVDQMSRAQRNDLRLRKANLVINALKRRKNGEKPVMSLADEVRNLDPKTKTENDVLKVALRKLSEVLNVGGA